MVQRSRRIILILGPVVFISVALTLNPSDKGALLQQIILAAFAPIGYILLLWNAFRRAPARMAKQFTSNPENIAQIGYRQMTFSDDGIGIKTEKVESKMTWNTIVRYADIDTHFLLYTGANQAYIIPKQKITPQDVETLGSLFKSHDLFKNEK